MSKHLKGPKITSDPRGLTASTQREEDNTPSPEPVCRDHSTSLFLVKSGPRPLQTHTLKQRARRKSPFLSPLSLLRWLLFPMSLSGQLLSSPNQLSALLLFKNQSSQLLSLSQGLFWSLQSLPSRFQSPL